MNLFAKIPKSIYYGSFLGTVAGTMILYKELGGSTLYQSEDQLLKGKVVIITGANCGIGEATAIECCKQKAKVIMACRNMKKCEKSKAKMMRHTKHRDVHCHECDLASQESIRKFAEEIIASEKSIYALVNNAGVMRCPKLLTNDGLEKQLGINHMGHFLLTNLLLDKLKGSAPSRIITTSCQAHSQGSINLEDFNSSKHYDASFAYFQSKLANVLFTKALAQRIEGTGVTCCAVDPSTASTKISRNMGYYLNPLTGIFVWPLMWLLTKTPRQAAQSHMWALIDDSVTDNNGAYISGTKIKEPAKAAQDEVISEWLWKTSEKWTKLV